MPQLRSGSSLPKTSTRRFKIVTVSSSSSSSCNTSHSDVLFTSSSEEEVLEKVCRSKRQSLQKRSSLGSKDSEEYSLRSRNRRNIVKVESEDEIEEVVIRPQRKTRLSNTVKSPVGVKIIKRTRSESEHEWEAEESDAEEFQSAQENMSDSMSVTEDQEYNLRSKRTCLSPSENDGPYKKRLRHRIEKSPTNISKGVKLGDIPKIVQELEDCTNAELEIFCRVCSIQFLDRSTSLRKLKNFNGLQSEVMDTKVELIKKLSGSSIKQMADILGVYAKGTKQDVAENIVEFLSSPQNDFIEVQIK